MAVAAVLVGCGLVPFVFMSAIIVGARGNNREEEDREQLEYLRQYAQQRERKRRRR